ncbi:MAG: DUF3426 domain-containing protein, partial [Desulfobacterales bacterium]|nr:DUF3426 domain-containing protein [Desulfobacterales bacterium]
EKLLESEELSTEVEDAVAGVEDLELELGDALEGETEKAGAAADSEEKLDLSEIEKMLETERDAADTLEESVELEDLELDLDLPDESLEEKVEEGEAAFAEVDDFELTDLEDVFETKAPEAQEDTFETEDLDLDFEIEEFDQADTAADLSEKTPEGEPREEIFAFADQTMASAETESKPVAAMAAAASPMIAHKKRMNAPLWVLLILLILGGGAFGTYTVLNRMGIEVPFARQLANLDIELPFIGRLMKPKVEDPGNLKIKTFEITSRFVTNTQHGKLFVISGQVKNEYPESRDAISITGKLYTKGKVEARNETVFCGNVLSDTELADLGLETIMQRLAKPFGGDANQAVKPGASLPFMVIFGNLPDDLEEFTIEVAGSSAAQ